MEASNKKYFPQDGTAPKFPISVKGVIFMNDTVVLLKNERDEYELPGGKLEKNESLEICLAREIKEELSVDVKVDKLIHSWVYNILDYIDVVIITYGCIVIGEPIIKISAEHKGFKLVEINNLHNCNLPEGYVKAVQIWHKIKNTRPHREYTNQT